MNKPFTLCKIYNDGSHFIAMPYIRDPDDKVDPKYKKDRPRVDYKAYADIDVENASVAEKYYLARYIFDRDYNEAMALPKKARFDMYADELFFLYDERKQSDRFVQDNLNRKFRNFVYRRLRLIRKVNLMNFNYFCTFTYDSAKMTESEFRKKFSDFMKNKAYRSNWKYIGVWERGGKKERLHFHCLLKAEESTINGSFSTKRVWSSKVKKMKTVFENDYIRSRFGINDFSPIESTDSEEYLGCIDYLLKYIEKSGEKIVYSRGLYQFLVANIDENDIIEVSYRPNIKLCLYDDFKAYNKTGELIGVCSKETLDKLRRSNI